MRKTDVTTRFYHKSDEEGPRDLAMYEQIGRIIVAWGAAESVLSKMWWHKAFEAGYELSRDRVYQAGTSQKLAALRKFVSSDGSRVDQQLVKLEQGFQQLENDRHALVHGYLCMTAKGPAVVNLRNDLTAFAIDLPCLLQWSSYLADVAHQLYEESTVHIYQGQDRLWSPDPIEPAPYVRSSVSGWPPANAG